MSNPTTRANPNPNPNPNSHGYEHLSHWFEQLAPLGPPRPALERSRDADVCIVGGGFTGLWTAYELKRADPSLDVVVLEAEIAGFGASGRNGGWVLGELAGSPERWAARSGRDATVALGRAIADTVAEVGHVVEREGIGCDFVRGGTLQVAQTPLQLERVRAVVDHDRAWGMGPQDSVLLGAQDAAGRVAVDGVLGARYFAHCARVQPAALARGLAEAVERSGVVIHEHTPVSRIEPGAAYPSGSIVRSRFIVRATEGYTARLAGLKRALLPMNSSMIVTEPLGESAWSELRWDGCETLHDGHHRYVYLQRTADGRIAIGGRGNPYRYSSASDREGPLPRQTIDALKARLVRLFPSLDGVAVGGAWHGVLGVPRDWSPVVGLDRSTGLAWAGGYVGEGVAAANLAGRTLCDLLLGRDTELARLPWVGRPARGWEPEPLRFLGVHSVNALLAAADRREDASGRPAVTARLARIISGRDF
ncbi:MAG TPA: FAD-dependent oxidoreductase [Solirubrobacteraceae bacterium]|nr:FAD-dependent oxidoreductase [Solirubrobacteraceae bacterium]